MTRPFHPIPAPVVAALVCLATAAAGNAQDTPPLPAEIVAYYRDVNFSAAFSTAEERERLLSGQETHEPEDPQKRRLTDVLEAVQRLKNQIWQPAPDRRPHAENLWGGSEWMKVVQAQVGRETAILRVRVVPIPPRLQREWIDAYESEKARPKPDGDRRRSVAVGTAGSWVEMHFWFAVDGRWMRKKGGIAQAR
jgi:hypothetical protein